MGGEWLAGGGVKRRVGCLDEGTEGAARRSGGWKWMDGVPGGWGAERESGAAVCACWWWSGITETLKKLGAWVAIGSQKEGKMAGFGRLMKALKGLGELDEVGGQRVRGWPMEQFPATAEAGVFRGGGV